MFIYHLIASGIISYPENCLSQNILLPQSFLLSKWHHHSRSCSNYREPGKMRVKINIIFINDLEAIREYMIVVNYIEALYIIYCPSHSNLRTML